MSVRQVQRLEQGGQIPTEAQMRSVATALSLDDAARRHLGHLVRRPDRAESVNITAANWGPIHELNPHLAAVLDWNWDILEMNDSYRNGFPGIDDTRNVLRWLLFDDRARRCMIEWEAETNLTIHWWKYNLAVYGENKRSMEVYRECCKSDLFRDSWSKAYVEARRSASCMWILDGDKAVKIAARLYTSPVPDGITYYLGVKA